MFRNFRDASKSMDVRTAGMQATAGTPLTAGSPVTVWMLNHMKIRLKSV
jgi:hypothetical protein